MIIINDRHIDPAILPDMIDEEGSPEWNLSIREAINEWYNDLKYIMMHTSGSTGKPKPIKLLKTDIEASARLTISTFNLSPGDRIVCCLPLNYIAGRLMLYRGLIGGLKIQMIEPCINPLIKLSRGCKFIALTPVQWERGLNDSPGRFNLVDIVLIGGAAISELLERRYQECVSEVYASYGMTETLTHVAIRKVGIQKYFEALEGVKFEIDKDGCLVIHVEHLSQPVFKINDLVDLIDNQRFIWKGRKDRVINVGGIKVSPEALEEKLKSIIKTPFFVSAIPDDRSGDRVVLVIEDVAWQASMQSVLTAFIEDKCDKYETPREIFFKEKFLLTHTGKVDRRRTLAQIIG